MTYTILIEKLILGWMRIKTFPLAFKFPLKGKFKEIFRIRGIFELICLVLGGLGYLGQLCVIDSHRDVTFWVGNRIWLYFGKTHIFVYTTSVNRKFPPAAHLGGIWHLWRKLPKLKNLRKTNFRVDITFRVCKIIRQEKRQKVFNELLQHTWK